MKFSYILHVFQLEELCENALKRESEARTSLCARGITVNV